MGTPSDTSHRWKFDTSGWLVGNRVSPQLQLTEAALARLNELNPSETTFFDPGESSAPEHLIPVFHLRPRASAISANSTIGIPLDESTPVLPVAQQKPRLQIGTRKGNGWGWGWGLRPLKQRLGGETTDTDSPGKGSRSSSSTPQPSTPQSPITRFPTPKPIVQYQPKSGVDSKDLGNFELYPSVFESPGTWLDANRKHILQHISMSDQLDVTDRSCLAEWVNKGIIYERCTLYVFEYLRTKHTLPALSHLAELKTWVQSWSEWSTVMTLHNNSSVFDQLQRFHPLQNDDPLMRKIIALDLDSICARISISIHHAEEYDQFVNIPESRAKSQVVMLLEALLEYPSLHPSYREPFSGALKRISGGKNPPVPPKDLKISEPGVDTRALGGFSLYPSTFESPEMWLDANREDLLHYISVSRQLDANDKILLTSWVNRGVIYERSTVYVYGHLRGKRTGRGPSDLAELMTWIEPRSAWDTITALHNYHFVFDRLQHLYSLWNKDTDLQKVIALDIDSMCARLYSILRDRGEYRRLVCLTGEQAQGTLNLLQVLLDSSSLHSSYRYSFTNALMRLSKKSGLHPDGLLQTNVTLQGEEAIAAGQFGDVWKGTFEGRTVAVKVLKVYLRSDRTKHLKKVLHEALIWRQLRHRSVLPFLCLHHVNKNSARISFVSPWLKNGNIQEFLRKYPYMNRMPLVQDISEGLEYLHTMQPPIVHGDLKSVNILITDTYSACLADFGLSTASDSQVLNLTSFSSAPTGGTSRWTAPELLNGDEPHNNKKSDIYAFACVNYEMFSGNIPFHNISNDYPVMLKVIQGQRPPRPVIYEPSGTSCASIGLNDDMWSIVEDCWMQQPNDRPAMSEVIARLPARIS